MRNPGTWPCQHKDIIKYQSLTLPPGKDKAKIVWSYSVKWEVNYIKIII